MKERWVRGSLLAGLLLLGLAPAQPQPGVTIYGAAARSSEVVQVEVSAPSGTVFRLVRVLDPAALFAGSRDPSRPTLLPGTRTSPVRTLRLARRTQGQLSLVRLSLGRLPSGVYLLQTGSLSAVVLVSDLGLVVKRDQASATTYSADTGSGQPRAARVWALGTGVSDSPTAATPANRDGLARFVRAAPTYTATSEDNEAYLAQYGNDWAISGARWNSYAAPLVRGYVYTDRPVYRPGQHVDFKAVLRQAGNLQPLSGRAVVLTVRSPDSEQLFRRTLTTNAYGSLSAGLDLPAGAPLGEYAFETQVQGLGGGGGQGGTGGSTEGRSEIGGSFQVEAYQKPEYAVTLTPDRARAVQGERVSLRVSARYLFGGSLGGARVNYNVTRAPYYSPSFDSESLAPDEQGSDYGSDLVIQEEARLNASGDLDLTLPLARDENGRPVSYRIEAEVEDESRRTVSAQTRVIAFPASLNVEASTDGYIYDAGKPIRVSLDTRTLEDVGRAAPVTLELLRQNYRYNKRSGEWTVSESRLARTITTTGAAGTGAATLRAPRGGGYLLRSTVTDSRGRRSTAETFVWVLKPGEDWGWNYRNMTVQLDRKTYAPGDTATVLVGNPSPGSPVLLTLEGDRLRRSVVLRGAGAALTYRLPVTADMTPNLFVAASALGDGQRYSGEAQLRVPRSGGALSVTVRPGQARYAPGDTGRLSVDVKTAGGQGVAAELALGVVDQAIYLVRRDTSTPISQVFDAPRDNAVGTQSSLDYYFPAVGLQAAAPRSPMTAAAFAQNKEDRAVAESGEVTPRQDFRDTILWLPQLVTDARGHAEVQVRFPDNLTTWVATVRAQSGLQGAAPRFGQATASTMTTKDVIARLSLPTFLVRGDRVTLAGVVNNTLGRPVTGTARATLGGLSPLSGAALTPAGAPLAMAAGGRVRNDVQVRAGTVGTANVTFTARTASGSDALRLPLSVLARGYSVTQTATGSAGQPTVSLSVPADASQPTVALTLSLTPSLLSAVAPALEYLVGYPYGCTEQTMSRFLPALLARQSLGAASLPGSVTRDLNAITDAGLARLALFQHQDGGWNFWENDESTLEMSAYVTQGLLRARALGARVNNRLLDRALTYLSRAVKDSAARPAERASAYRALAEAGRVNAAQLAQFARRRDLPPYALAQTALALQAAGNQQASRDLLERLSARRVGGAGGLLHWESPRTVGDGWYTSWDDNSIQVTATALEALARLEPASPLIPGASQWLLRNRRGRQWVSTQDTTSVIIAALALNTGAQKPAAAVRGEVTVLLDGAAAGRATVNGREAVSLPIDAARLSPGRHTVTLQGAPAGLSYSAALSYSREPATLSGDASKGLRLSRQYQRLEPVWNAADKRYTYRRTPLLRGGVLQPVTVGDLLLVTLSVQPLDHSARYLLISDPIPAGMKAQDERSLAITGLQDPDEYDWENWNYWYAGRELRDDRVDLYADYLSGRQTMTYVLRAQTPGTFTALPTHAFLMYSPEVEGYAPAATLTVRDRGQ